METKLYIDIKSDQWPIVYRPEYNVYFMGLERLHPFDAKKWGNIFKYLKIAGLIDETIVTVPNEATEEDLLVVHSKKYLKSLKYSCIVAKIAEVLPLAFVPNFLIQRAYLKPMRFQTGGSILAGKLALERGWSINLGGGFHHCCSNKGGGFCVYADITLLIHFVLNHYPQTIQNIMIIDLDAHQGNGYQRDFKDFRNIYIFDMYNKNIYPFDHIAKNYITRKIELNHFTDDVEYLSKLQINLQEALNEFLPHLVVYNAGTDILKGDPLGALSVTAKVYNEFKGIIERDEIVFRSIRTRNIPIVMLTSGGYLKRTAKIIASSILNLYDLRLIEGPIKRF